MIVLSIIGISSSVLTGYYITKNIPLQQKHPLLIGGFSLALGLLAHLIISIILSYAHLFTQRNFLIVDLLVLSTLVLYTEYKKRK